MSHKRAFRMGFALILAGLFLYGCGNPPASEAPAAAPTAEPPIPTDVNTEAPAATPTPKPPIPTEEIATEEPTIDSLGAGDTAPDFALPDSTGNMVRLADELLDNRLVILVFYFHHT